MLLRLLLPSRVLPVPVLPNELLPTARRQVDFSDQWKVLLTSMAKTANNPEQVWHVLSDDLRAFIRSRVRHQSDADDILQDVFVRVLEKIDSLRKSDRIEAWVYQIARNVIADFYRRPTRGSTEPVEDVAVNNDVDADANENHAVAAWLLLMIDSLPETQRDAVQMYELEGRSQSEIADHLGISHSGAKSRVQRGRSRLEEMLQGCCQLELDRRGNVIECRPATADCCEPASCKCSNN